MSVPASNRPINRRRRETGFRGAGAAGDDGATSLPGLVGVSLTPYQRPVAAPLPAVDLGGLDMSLSTMLETEALLLRDLFVAVFPQRPSIPTADALRHREGPPLSLSTSRSNNSIISISLNDPTLIRTLTLSGPSETRARP